MCSIYKVCVYLLLAGCTFGRTPSDDPKEIEIRLVGGSSNVPGRVASGRVEVRKPNGEWGTVCDDSWDVLDATVACRQLGFVWGEAHREGRFGLGTGNIHYDSMDCKGTEKSLTECSHDGWGQNDCFHDEDAGVTCYNQTVQFAGKTNMGTVQVRYSLQAGTNNFTWAFVCDDGWHDTDATVMCKQLGFVFGIALHNTSFNWYGPFNQAEKDIQDLSLTGFQCQGSETDLQACPQSSVLTKGCGDKKFAAGVCYNTTKENINRTIAVRINAKNNNESYWGRVEVRYLDVWGHVCRDNWDDRDAAVVCRQSGYLGGKAFGPLYNSSGIESSTLTAEWLNNVDCNGKENTLEECKFSFHGKIINCQPAYVLCYNSSGISISIVSDSPVRGLVEITYDGMKGAICKDSWSHFDAVVVCQQLGYIDGDSSDGSFTGNYFMNRMRCSGFEKSLLMCANAGWKAVTNCNEAGYVTCYKNVRLSQGNALGGSGIVEIYNNGSWDGLCDDGFNDTNAQVVCRELGYTNGSTLPIGAFGSYYGDLVRPYISCKGNESSIHSCSYNRRSKCGQFKYDYASVSCYNQTESLAFSFKLQGSSPTSDYGRVFYYQHGIWGDICGLFWNEIDATIFCKSLNNNYKGGVPLYYSKIPNTATLIGEIDCKGTEVSIENCTKVDTACYSSYSAGALCYRISAPVIKLVGGGKNFGRVSIDVDGQSGTICDDTWTQNDAMVICKQFNKNFTGGEPYSNFPQDDGDVVLSQPSCFGTETSILACASKGWKQVTSTSCLQHSLDVGVYCYSNVRLMGGSRSADYIAGRLEVLDVSGANNWLTVCATSFNQSDADTVCRDLGFPYAQILAPVSFGEASSWRYYTDMACKEGGTNTHEDCTFEAGFCKDPKKNQASVLCSKTASDPNLKFSISNGNFHGEVLVEQFGMKGTICTDGWDNRDAKVLCKQQGYAGGVAFGVPVNKGTDVRENPVWFTEVNCTGNETSLKDCPMSHVVSSKCSISERSASVLCYKSGEIKVRLANSNGSDHYGRVEIQYEGVWGTVCDYGWSIYDAQVLCRQQGFKDGIAFKSSPYGPGTGPVYLSDMACDSTEATLLACPNKGWTNVDSMCKDHTRDASVYCYREVMTNVEDNYGPVNVWNDGKYSAVCSDGFDDIDAKVACRNMGFEYGTSLCCSAFGDVNSSPVLISNVNCIGTEVNFTQCPFEYGALTCKSKEYASVVCSKTEPQLEFDVRLSNNNFGLVMLKWYNQWGYVCSEGFDARDANVTCKQLGFSGGFSYRSAESGRSQLKSTKKVHWVSGISCNGTEKRLEECGPLKWGRLKKCSFDSHAAAYCYMKEEDSKLEVRLKGGNIPREGLVEIRIGGVWGSVCGQTMTDDEATVLCRMNNFKYGTRIRYHHYGSLNGQVAINFMKCKGNETSIVDCPLSGFGDKPVESSCLSHRYDLAVKCYAHVRLSGFTSPSYGQLQVLRDKQWVSVCDQGFGDKEAEVVCKTLGHKNGKAQCCSALGTTMTKYNPIIITNVKCQGMESNFDQCIYSVGQCTSEKYVSVACSMDSTPVEGFTAVNFTEGLFYGSLEVRRFGITGSVCDMNWNDKAANVTCKMMGYLSGFAINVTYTGLLPILISNIQCTGEETSLDQCKYDEFIKGHNCTERLSQAGVVCSQYANEKVMYRLGNRTEDVGRAEVYLNGKWGTICDIFWEDDDSDVFCRQIGYAGGRESSAIYSGSEGQHIWMNRVECNGKETDFRQCRATWDKKKVSSCSHYNDAGVVCYQSVRLNRGDFLTSKTNGIVEVFRNGVWGTICANGFTRKEADVACQVLGHEHGIPLCCAPYGHNFRSHSILNVNCTGIEKHLTDCNYVVQTDDRACSYQNYAAVSCFNGTQPVDDHALTIVGEQPYTGQLAVKYLRVSGRVCSDGWDDKDARVACRELGYQNGQAYLHYKSPFTFMEYEGPYWTSQVECTGNESRLSECKHIGFGNVTVCDSRHYAGVFCYSDKGIFYKLTGGGDRFGRVSIVINGEEGTICNRNWDSREADVLCRQLGFSTGEIYAGSYTDVAKGKVWDTHFMCTGYENNLDECVLGGWELATRWSCEIHKDDVGVSCYSNVKLSTLSGKSASSGAVQLYANSRWWRVCDDGFDDFTAKKVCEELGFVDGRSICCSSFGVTYSDILTNTTLHCDRDDKSIANCIKDKPCNSSFYASAVCFSSYNIEENKYSFSLEKKDKGQVKVDHYGITGRICSRDWDDKDALVTCRMSGFDNGIAYQHSESTVLEMLRGPYWLAGLNCTGNETDLLQCPRNDHTDLGNCSEFNIASVLCYNGTNGIQYKISGIHYGRVELAIGGVWGTICDSYWDKREAEVLCRQLNYTDGDVQPRGFYGEGKGPIWLSHLECTGEESNLHECPHRGFNSEDSDILDLLPSVPCETHKFDASVFCYKHVRLNQSPNLNMGGVEMHHEEKWYGICDVGFDIAASRVACRSLNHKYIDARPVGGSSFGNLTVPIGISSVKCQGTEEDLSECQYVFNSTCISNTYASVVCSNVTIEDKGFEIHIAQDVMSGPSHGILEVKMNGVLGRVCLKDFDDKDARVACRQMRYDDGVAYLHIMRNRGPFLLRGMRCNGSESSLLDCPRNQEVDLANCSHGAYDAGVICYNTTNGMPGFSYRLNGGPNNSSGRVEINFLDEWGQVCSGLWRTPEANVVCRSMNFTSGLISYNYNDSLPQISRFVDAFYCEGTEATLMTCLNTGLNKSIPYTGWGNQCIVNDPGTYVSCYNVSINATKIRLISDEKNNSLSGRLEVFVEGPNQWGTVCDKYFSDIDSAVVCRQLGFSGGIVAKAGTFSLGEGPIWYEDVSCSGAESTLFECKLSELGTKSPSKSCSHLQDVGVVCSAATTTTTSNSTISTTTHMATSKILTTEPTIPSSKSTTASESTTVATTARTTTAKPYVTTIATTEKITTIVTASTTLTSTTTSAASTTTRTTTRTARRTASTIPVPSSSSLAEPVSGASHNGSEEGPNLAMIVAIPAVIIIAIIITLALVFLFKIRRVKQRGFPHERFDAAIIDHGQDGSIIASNQLFDLQSANGVSHSPPDDKLTISQNGNAYYSRGSPLRFDSDSNAFTNPLYESSQETNLNSGDIATLPVNGELGFADSCMNDERETHT